MRHPQIIYRKGRTYRIQTSGRYYQDQDRKNCTERLLHRVVWTEHHGSIPPHHSIHHKDGDWGNNRISNLELVETSAHCRHHMRERFADPVQAKRFIAFLRSGSDAAVRWHKSPEGREWHSNHAKNQWKKRKPSRKRCEHCKSYFLTKHPGQARFCSNSCTQRARRPKLYTDRRKCKVCGDSFLAFKYDTVSHCSHHCAAITVGRIKKRRRLALLKKNR